MEARVSEKSIEFGFGLWSPNFLVLKASGNAGDAWLKKEGVSKGVGGVDGLAGGS